MKKFWSVKIMELFLLGYKEQSNERGSRSLLKDNWLRALQRTGTTNWKTGPMRLWKYFFVEDYKGKEKTDIDLLYLVMWGREKVPFRYDENLAIKKLTGKDDPKIPEMAKRMGRTIESIKAQWRHLTGRDKQTLEITQKENKTKPTPTPTPLHTNELSIAEKKKVLFEQIFALEAEEKACKNQQTK